MAAKGGRSPQTPVELQDLRKREKKFIGKGIFKKLGIFVQSPGIKGTMGAQDMAGKRRDFCSLTRGDQITRPVKGGMWRKERG